jgi:hypothetical protein
MTSLVRKRGRNEEAAMATAPLRVSAPQSLYRDFEIALADPEERTSPARVICSDAGTGLIIGSPSIAPGRGDVQQGINVDEVIRMIVAVDIGADELKRQSRRVADELRVRRRLWRRRSRPRTSPA